MSKSKKNSKPPNRGAKSTEKTNQDRTKRTTSNSKNSCNYRVNVVVNCNSCVLRQLTANQEEKTKVLKTPESGKTESRSTRLEFFKKIVELITVLLSLFSKFIDTFFNSTQT